MTSPRMVGREYKGSLCQGENGVPATLKDGLEYTEEKSSGEVEAVRREVEAGQTCAGRAHLEFQGGSSLAGVASAHCGGVGMRLVKITRPSL